MAQETVSSGFALHWSSVHGFPSKQGADSRFTFVKTVMAGLHTPQPDPLTLVALADPLSHPQIPVLGGAANHCIFSENDAVNGGAMYEGTVNNCTFTSNHATKSGAIYCGTANNCTFTSNSAASYGGATYYVDATKSTFKISFRRFR